MKLTRRGLLAGVLGLPLVAVLGKEKAANPIVSRETKAARIPYGKRNYKLRNWVEIASTTTTYSPGASIIWLKPIVLEGPRRV